MVKESIFSTEEHIKQTECYQEFMSNDKILFNKEREKYSYTSFHVTLLSYLKIKVYYNTKVHTFRHSRI